MNLGHYIKAPGDRKRYVVDYVDWLDTNERITQVTVTTPSNTASFFVDGSVIGSTSKDTIFFVSGGVEGGSYVVDITIYTDRQQIKTDTVTFEVTSKGRKV